MLFKQRWLLLTAFMFIYTANVLAQDDEVVTMSTTIVGNQEQPKVLYIVPWQPATDITILSLPVTSLMSDVFDHIDREEHRREIQFIEALDGTESVLLDGTK